MERRGEGGRTGGETNEGGEERGKETVSAGTTGDAL